MLQVNGFDSNAKTATNLQQAINSQAVREAIAGLINAMYGAKVEDPTSTGINAVGGDQDKLKVVLTPATGGLGTGIQPGEGEAELTFSDNTANQGVKVTIKISTAGSLKTGSTDNNAAAGDMGWLTEVHSVKDSQDTPIPVTVSSVGWPS